MDDYSIVCFHDIIIYYMFPANNSGDSLAGDLRFAIFAINFFEHFKYLYLNTLSYKKVIKKARVIRWISMNYPIILALNLTKNPQNRGFCALLAFETLIFRLPEHKNPIFVSKRPKISKKSPILTQKCQLCARKAGKWGSRGQKAHKNPDFVGSSSNFVLK